MFLEFTGLCGQVGCCLETDYLGSEKSKLIEMSLVDIRKVLYDKKAYIDLLLLADERKA
jgi:hypothetical protein